MSYIQDNNNEKIWYEVFEGREPVILFIHGYAMNSTVWKNQLEFFKEHKRIIFDLRGHGKSSHSLVSSLETLSKDISAILSKEKLKKVIIVGHSLGGTVALMFQKLFPEKVEKMILINPYINQDQMTLKSRFLIKLLDLLFFYPRFNFDHSKKSLFPVLKCVFSTRLRSLKTGKKMFLRDFDFKLPNKTLVINSSKDEIIKPYFRKGVLLDGKHVLQVDKPEMVNTLIKDFLRLTLNK